MCNCSDQAVQRTVNKASAHQGRKFWTCPKPQGEQCGFFVSPSASSAGVHESR
jgi:DNA topoisomerase-3